MKVTHRSAHSEMVFLHAIHWGRQFHALRSGILQSGAENPATPRQPVRHEVVTHVLGTWCYLSVRAGHRGKMVAGERLIRLPPSISAFSPSAAPLAEATRRLAGYAHNYPGLRRFAVLALEYTSMERSERSTSARHTLQAYRHSLAVGV